MECQFIDKYSEIQISTLANMKKLCVLYGNNLNSLLHIYSFKIGKIKFTFVRNIFCGIGVHVLCWKNSVDSGYHFSKAKALFANKYSCNLKTAFV